MCVDGRGELPGDKSFTKLLRFHVVFIPRPKSVFCVEELLLAIRQFDQQGSNADDDLAHSLDDQFALFQIRCAAEKLGKCLRLSSTSDAADLAGDVIA